MRTQRKQRRAEERRAREIRREIARLLRQEKDADPRDLRYDLTGEWEPVKAHEWDEF
jgi:hypothetical protein